ncbi:protein LZIC [Cryptotermes secundus]|uniref:protein LZIC n=1 Tax=Cryptotermes secundus TaxID=105785 RepID=UPI000CD7C02B|nr:protein LZIC [Cryptotermes secundus]
MTSRGQAETEKLRQNLEGQLDRLVQQLADLEECKDDIDPSEYEETKSETMEQLQEFNESLSKMISGDMTLVDQLGSMQLATQAAISAAFHTPAVIRMFARREPDLLRERLAEVDRDEQLGKLSVQASTREKTEILSALRQLEERLSPAELKFLEQQLSSSLENTGKQFVRVSDTLEAGERALEMARSEVRAVNHF